MLEKMHYQATVTPDLDSVSAGVISTDEVWKFGGYIVVFFPRADVPSIADNLCMHRY
jgi:hypothetical protein